MPTRSADVNEGVNDGVDDGVEGINEGVNKGVNEGVNEPSSSLMKRINTTLLRISLLININM